MLTIASVNETVLDLMGNTPLVDCQRCRRTPTCASSPSWRARTRSAR